MKLMTKELEKQIPRMYEEDGKIDGRKFYAHYFIPSINFDWWVSEYDPEEKVFFGYVNLNNPDLAEWGKFSLEEFESLNRSHPFTPVERDKNFKPMEIEELAKIHSYLNNIL